MTWRGKPLGAGLDSKDLRMLELISGKACEHCGRGESPTLQQLAKVTGLHRMTVRDRRDRLMQLGLIERAPGRFGGMWLTEAGKERLQEKA